MNHHLSNVFSGSLLIVLCVNAGCGSGKPAAPGGGVPTAESSSSEAAPALLSAVQVREILELHNRGIGSLENKEWAEAESALSRLQSLLPANPDTARNLAIGRALSLLDRESPYNLSKDPKAYADMLVIAEAAFSTFRSLAESDEQKAIAALIAGKVAVLDDGPAKPRMAEGLDLLRQATTLSGDRPEMWYAQALAMDGHRDYAESPELIRTFQKISELVPENLAVIGRLLEKQSLGLSSQNPETVKLAQGLAVTLEKAAVLIEPMNAAIKAQRRIDLVDTIRKALTGPAATDPKLLMGPAMMTKNLMLPELATQIDQRRMDRNLLEYLVIDLAVRLPMSAEVRAEVFPPTEPTVLQAFTEGSGLPDVSGVTDLKLLDLNLDSADDLVLVQDGRIRILSRGLDAAAEWTPIMESPADAGRFTHCLLIDIDRDFDRALSDIKDGMILRDMDGDTRIINGQSRVPGSEQSPSPDTNGDRKPVKDPVGKPRWFDTDPDIIAWSDSGVVILRNDAAADGTRTLTVLPQTATMTAINDVAAADLEADGDLDLIFATATGMALWKNMDGTTFEPITEGVSLPSYGLSSVAIGDWNRDMAMDVVGVSPDGKAGWLQNILHTRFRWVDGLPGTAGAADVVIDELTGDGVWDLVITGTAGTTAVLPIHSDRTDDATAAALSADAGTSLHRADLDNDGRSDFITAGPGGLTILRGTGDGKTADLSKLLPPGTTALRAATSDMDDDGDLDIVIVTADGPLQLLVNNGGHQNQWIDVVARAVGDDQQFPSNRVNMHGLGSVIEVRAGAAYQAHIIDLPKMHLGLGGAVKADTIRIIWTDGVPQNVTDTRLLNARLGILAPQILKGSCPYIYTWNGERFTFFSDCLWAAPLGLVQATGDMAPTREWEYLLIPGEQLKAREGRYVLQLTEELWEAAYFDEVKLVAVDHPADVSIFTNEKVGSAQMAAHRIHTVKNPRLPVSARDGLGRDLLPGLQDQDQDYVQPFKGRLMQGLTDEWTMEFNLGELSTPDQPVPKNIRLVLIGWVFPTDTSLNQAIIQNPDLNPPAPPSLEVVDTDGSWKTVRPFIGFPSGKTKAMVIDLSDVFSTNDYRFRIRSSMELYWDQAFFTVDETDAETRSHDCPLAAADLHYRGFSRRIYADNSLFRNGHAPEGYDYDSVTTEPRWNEMLGRFTRYGDATELLVSQDDRMIVMGSGDELTVEFTVPPDGPPAGWQRDFVLYNVGWDKDADLNTVYGQSSEPYPFKAMTKYPIAPDEAAPVSPGYQQYINEYQTREYPRFRFRDVVRGR